MFHRSILFLTKYIIAKKIDICKIVTVMCQKLSYEGNKILQCVQVEELQTSYDIIMC